MISEEQLLTFINVQSPQIKGWFYPADMLSFYFLGLIQNQLAVAGSLCEIGVYEGKSLVLLSQMRREGERLLGFDLFPADSLPNTRANLDQYGSTRDVELHAGDTSALTIDGLRTHLPEGLRLLHIDAGHEYHEVLHQLTLFAPFVRNGGVIIMDDYQDREFPGIEAAVLDFCERDRPRRFVPFFAGANKMYLCERHWAAVYQRFLLGMEAVRDKSRVTRVRDFNVLVGFSKLPVPAQACLAAIDGLEFPLVYETDERALAVHAARFDQVTFGSGKSRNA